MDTAKLTPDYQANDFAQAIRYLLPKGEYWQEAENPELTQTIMGMAIDFKATHDDIELSLLTEFNERPFGWKIKDYQTLLFETVAQNCGQVFDDVHTPNLIYAVLKEKYRPSCKLAYSAIEPKRLPHTEIAWLYHSTANVTHNMANYRHIRNRHNYKVSQ